MAEEVGRLASGQRELAGKAACRVGRIRQFDVSGQLTLAGAVACCENRTISQRIPRFSPRGRVTKSGNFATVNGFLNVEIDPRDEP